MTPDTGELTPEPPATKSSWFARIPLWARIAVPVLVVAGGAAVVASVVAAGAQPPVTVESLCRAEVEASLERRGHTEIDVGRSFDITEADGAQRVSGTVTSVNESGDYDHAQLRCVVRVEGDTIRVVSARTSD
jgi:hypothetical protein